MAMPHRGIVCQIFYINHFNERKLNFYYITTSTVFQEIYLSICIKNLNTLNRKTSKEINDTIKINN